MWAPRRLSNDANYTSSGRSGGDARGGRQLTGVALLGSFAAGVSQFDSPHAGLDNCASLPPDWNRESLIRPLLRPREPAAMLDQAALQCGSPRAELRPKSSTDRVLTAALLGGLVLSGLVYTCCLAFSCFVNYDDEGVVLLFVQHMLDGHAIYDAVNCLYGPFYLFARWVMFGVLGAPLGNDALRVEALVTWWAATLLLAMTAWRLARGVPCRAGITGLVWILALCQLFVLPREPGHPQEVVAVLVAAALLVAVTLPDRRRIALVLLGGLGAAVLLTKVNVGVFYLLALAITLLSLSPRSSVAWFALRCATACAILVLPSLLMKSRFENGYLSFCCLATCALIPCLAHACFKDRAGTIRLTEILWCGLGAVGVAAAMVAFAVWQGNTIGGMINALLLRTWGKFASAPVGTPMPVSWVGIGWAAAAAALGVTTVRSTPAWAKILWPLRLVPCVMIVLIAASRNHEVFIPVSFALPLVWLLLIPPRGSELTEREWFFRLFLALTACLQPLQIFPVTGSQVLIGTFVWPVVGVVLAFDVWREARRLAETQPSFFPSLVPDLKRLLLAAIALASLRPRTYDIFGGHWTLPSMTANYAILAAAVGYVALRYESSLRKFLWPLKLIVCGWIVFGIASSPPWDMTWLRLALPLCWLIWVDTADRPIGDVYLRLSLIAAGCLELLGLIPVVHLVGRPFHFAVFLMLAIAGVLLMDVARDLRVAPRFANRTWSLRPSANIVLLLVALLVGTVSAIDAEEGYRTLVPLDLPGCHWTRMTERDAAFCRFLAVNVRRSFDCVFARFGLESLHFWAEQRPASDVVPISNLWAQMNRSDDERLLQAHRGCGRMLFIDNPDPWDPVPPKMQFLDYVASHFKLLGRLGATRLLVRNEQSDLELYDCAFEPRAANASEPRSILSLRLHAGHALRGVAAIELLDLNQEPEDQLLASTPSNQPQRLTLVNALGRPLLPAAGPIDISAEDKQLRVSLPAALDLSNTEFPVLRFVDGKGRRLLTLPVLVDVNGAVH
jgi:hypothetical protein